MSILPVSKFANQLVEANQYLKHFKFPFDGQRQIYPDRYSGILPKETVKEIVNNTYYLTWSQIYQGIRKQVQEFEPTTEFYIYIPNQGLKSELVMLAATWDLWQDKLPTGFMFGIPTDLKFKEMTVVFLDDWSLTGVSQTCIIDDLTYSNKNIKFEFEILTPYMTTDAVDRISDITKHLKCIIDTINVHIGTVSDEWYNKNILFTHLTFGERPHKKISELSEEIGNNDFFCIYSDIKITDSCCCPRKFYLQTVDPPPFNIKQELEQFFPNLKSSEM